ncbi:hypothetical protein [Gaetbulibacter saemankumensis]|uniref:hypothetical protein n=1 Tax=Gaetbulibacter saemankumensis TaxID=311208 RepID=UPI00040F41CD|nr:hypothetical protein [Gaetbulibacter saemankumensis]
MKNRELTFYSLLPNEDLRHIFYMADTMESQEFINLGFDEKWRHHLWVVHNNNAFVGLIENQVTIKALNSILDRQLKLYIRKHSEGCKENNEDLLRINEEQKNWLKHTIFICKNEFNRTDNEIYNEAVKWCKKQLKQANKKRSKPKNTHLNKEVLLNKQNKLIPNVSIEDVFTHFEILTKATNKDQKCYLTEQQLLIFIKSTFIDLAPIKQNFNCIMYSKKDIRSVFYRFFKKSTILEGKQSRLKQKYFNIMNDAFVGFNDTDLKEFNKTNNNIEA